MKQQNLLMQKALQHQWSDLPEGLKNHYRENDNAQNFAVGYMAIDYPCFMQWFLTLLYFFGALVNRKGKIVKTLVTRTSINGQQHWQRIMIYSNGVVKKFNSVVVFDVKSGCFIEYINAFCGVRLKAFIDGPSLRYESQGYVMRIGRFKFIIPESLALGHVSIEEKQSRDGGPDHFEMDFRLKHDLFGEIFSYKGRFCSKF